MHADSVDELKKRNKNEELFTPVTKIVPGHLGNLFRSSFTFPCARVRDVSARSQAKNEKVFLKSYMYVQL